ncbi:MAG: hypothetical protein HQK50_00540 [Oligoflexia bacterium]|nr:hypothetical protein [Oligoflexia bacterium]MBF0364023.1 hypothetical protein [Oligoflexia bacterium]
MKIKILFLVILGSFTLILIALLLTGSQETWPWMLFSGVVLLALFLAGEYFILRPLQLLVGGLKSENMLLLHRMAMKQNEWGELAKLLVRTLDSGRENVKMERNLFQRDKMATLGSFASGVASEINNPLTMLAGPIKQLEQGAAEGAIQDPYLLESITEVNKCYEKISETLQTLKAFAPSEHGEFRPFTLHQLLLSTLELLTKIYAKEGIFLQKEFLAQNDWVYGSKGQLKQAFCNLLSHAKEAVMEKKKYDPQTAREIIVSTRNSNDNTIIIEVRDNGCGIPERYRSKIFDPYVTVGSGVGIGVGLSVAYEIFCNYHKGNITFDSQTGVGSSFTVTLETIKQENRSSTNA